MNTFHLKDSPGFGLGGLELLAKRCITGRLLTAQGLSVSSSRFCVSNRVYPADFKSALRIIGHPHFAGPA
ncbi:MAG: hypothetical protein AB7V14_01395 [Kiritimatiellia bacterium]